jgi:sulfatase modifying factor 1
VRIALSAAPCALMVLAGCAGTSRTATVPPGSPIPVAPENGAERRRAREVAQGRREPTAEEEPAIDGCPADMVAIGAYCIDRYEAPNARGEIPFALVTAYDGEAWCTERGKRLCTQDEWVRACEGPRGRRYPYGNEYREGVCNDDKGWILVHWKALAKWPRDPALDEATRLFQADMSGARAECVSEEGVADLTGNVAEWVRRSTPSGRTGYDHVLKGCYWAGCYKDPHPSCGFTNAAHPGTFRTYEAGFRCCSKRRAATGQASTGR